MRAQKRALHPKPPQHVDSRPPTGRMRAQMRALQGWGAQHVDSRPPTGRMRAQMRALQGWGAQHVDLRPAAPYPRTRPSVEMVTTCTGSCLPLACTAARAARSRPPQHGTSMRSIVTLRMLLSATICASFSV